MIAEAQGRFNPTKMKLVGIGTVKNEADIIESFVRHNLGRLDALVLIDDGSVDGTREILLSLEAEGLNLVTLEWDGPPGQEQSMKLSELLLVLVSRMKFDWVFPLDADEAIDCESRAALEKALQQVAEGCVGILPWRSYVLTAADDRAQRNPFRRIVNRKAQETPQFYKVAIPKERVKLSPIVIASGNHTVRRAIAFKQVPMVPLKDVALDHFPVRSPDQLVSKVICGWLSICAEGSGRPSRGFHWREMYAQFVRNGAPTSEEIERLARRYSGQTDDGSITRSPLRIADPSQLRYVKNIDVPMFVSIARTAEQLIGRCFGSAKGNHCVDMIRQRTSWRHRAWLFRGSRFDQDGAVGNYLERRLGRGAQFLDEKNGHNPSVVFRGTSSSPTNRETAIVLMGPRNHRNLAESRSWLSDGWAVDHTATLAVRLLATSARVRRYAVVLIPGEKDGGARVSGDSIPTPSDPGWRAAFGFGVLRCNLLAVKCYWFFRSAGSREKYTRFLDRIGLGQHARDVGMGGVNWDSKRTRQ